MAYVNGLAGTGALTPPPASTATQGQQNTPERSMLAPGFRKAVKFDAKARVAFVGVSGSGKSYTALILARALAGPTGKIAAIDTEHGSLSLYSDIFSFDVDEPDSYSTEYLLEQLDYAEDNGYAVFLVDSLSHFWMGKDGALEFVDAAKRRSRDGMEGWKAFKPHERQMVDRFLASPCHIIVTMRTKTDYEETIVDGKKKRVKIGLAPVQREGLEYEFTFVGSMDDENNLIVDKTRCSLYSQEKMRSVSRPDARYFQPFIDWLAGVKRETAPGRPVSPAERQLCSRIDTGGHPIGTVAAADHVAQAKLSAAASAQELKPTPPPLPTKAGEIRRAFQQVREQIGEVRYFQELELAGVNDPLQFRTRNQAQECFNRMWLLSQMKEAM